VGSAFTVTVAVPETLAARLQPSVTVIVYSVVVSGLTSLWYVFPKYQIIEKPSLKSM